MANNWVRETLRRRTQGDSKRLGYSPSAPDGSELETYLAQVGPSRREVLVMGMTVTLREALLADGHAVTCVENSPDVIEFLKDAIRPDNKTRETILVGDWVEMDSLTGRQFDIIVGDGVFGVLPVEVVPQVLAAIRRVLSPSGVLVTRMLLVPDHFDFAENTQDELLAKFRAGQIGVEDFAMGMRLWANFEAFYDAKGPYFKNEKSFALLKELLDKGVLSASEHVEISRRYYGGDNYLPLESIWEKTLKSAGFKFSKTVLSGHEWYQYFPMYICTPDTEVPK